MRIENLAGEPEGERRESGQTVFLGTASPPPVVTGAARLFSPVGSERPEKKSCSESRAVGARKMQTDKLAITELRQGVKNPNRVNVFVNGKFELSLDVAQVVDLGVQVGRILSEGELAELKRASEFGKLYQRTLEWVLARPRSVMEARDYLRRKSREKGLDLSYSKQIIDRLSSKGYLDDRKFAAYYVENRFVKKGVSRKRLSMELAKKGIDKEVIAEILSTSERNEAEEARKIIARKRRQYADDKLIAYLCRQGFSYQLAQELVNESSDGGLVA